jgi:predicted acylesterase/phospholipase RssA
MSGRPDFPDAHNRQYVDLVMPAAVSSASRSSGYLCALEVVGVRFRRIGGTSAGSITALLLAALDSSDQRKAEKLVEILSQMDTGRSSTVARRPRPSSVITSIIGTGLSGRLTGHGWPRPSGRSAD